MGFLKSFKKSKLRAHISVLGVFPVQVIAISDTGLDVRNCMFYDSVYAAASGRAAPFTTFASLTFSTGTRNGAGLNHREKPEVRGGGDFGRVLRRTGCVGIDA